MSSLELNLLGRFQARRSSGEDIALPTRKTKLILARLALRPGEALTREALIGLLWSDRGDEQARASLRQALTALRHALNDAAPAALLIKGESIQLDPTAVAVDASNFERLARSADPAALDEAIALYRGALLEGIVVREALFADWLGYERERLSQLIFGALTTLLRLRREEGATAAAIAVAQRILSLDPLREDAHRALITLFAEAGQRNLALKQYETCSNLLRSELGLHPEPETERAHQETLKRRHFSSHQSVVSVQSADAGPDRAVVSGDQETFPLQPAVAVLPFDNLSGDPGQEYFSDGLTEELIIALGCSGHFSVIARSSTFTFKAKPHDVKQIAFELGARYIVEGSVRKGGQLIRVAARLIDGQTGHHIWSQKYDGELAEIFSLQDELTQRIVAAIEPELSRAERRRTAHKRTSDLDAWDCYLRGMALLERFTKEDNGEARAMFERAIALDPDYSDAYSSLATSHARDLLLECSENREESITRCFVAARKAVELNPASALAHHALSTAHIWRDEHDLSLAEARLAVKLNPSDAYSLHGLGNKSDLAGDPNGVLLMIRAQQLDPQDRNRPTHLTFLARALVNARRYDEAVVRAREAIDRRPDYPHAHFILAIALGHLGHIQEAREALDSCRKSHPGFIEGRVSWRPYTNDLGNEHLHEGLRKASG